MTNETTNNPAPEDIDLYCLNCGYNLRGLSGDPIRCPECGHLNRLELLTLPKELVKKELNKLGYYPMYCCISAVFIAFGFIIFLTAGRIHLDDWESIVVSCVILCFVSLGIVGWIWGASKFRKSCQAKPGWLILLLKSIINSAVGVILS